MSIYYGMSIIHFNQLSKKHMEDLGINISLDRKNLTEVIDLSMREDIMSMENELKINVKYIDSAFYLEIPIYNMPITTDYIKKTINQTANISFTENELGDIIDSTETISIFDSIEALATLDLINGIIFQLGESGVIYDNFKAKMVLLYMKEIELINLIDEESEDSMLPQNLEQFRQKYYRIMDYNDNLKECFLRALGRDKFEMFIKNIFAVLYQYIQDDQKIIESLNEEMATLMAIAESENENTTNEIIQ